MGGERETTVSSKANRKGKIVLGDFRIHESEGEVHFHNDSSKLKAAVPSGIWFQAWLRLMDQCGSFTFVDSERNTIVTVKVTADGDQIDADILVDKIGVGDAFRVLHEFTIRK